MLKHFYNFYFKRLFTPRSDFVRKTRQAYLQEYKTVFPETHSSFSFVLPGRALTGVVFVILFLVSASAYADSSNVGPYSLLYPLKRSYEKAQIILSDKEARPQLHAELALRRLEEVRTVSERNDTPKAKELSIDAYSEALQSLKSIRDTSPETGLAAPSYETSVTKESPSVESFSLMQESNFPKDMPVEKTSPKENAPPMGARSQVFNATETLAEDAGARTVYSPCESIRELFVSDVPEVQARLQNDSDVGKLFLEKCEVGQ